MLVLYPEEWRDGDVVRTDRIEDVSRAIEVSLEGGRSGRLECRRRTQPRTRRAGRQAPRRRPRANASALADFVGNHYAKRIESLTGPELSEFCTEYFVRNAWPSPAQRDVVEESIELVYETADEPVPEFRIR